MGLQLSLYPEGGYYFLYWKCQTLGIASRGAFVRRELDFASPANHIGLATHGCRMSQSGHPRSNPHSKNWEWNSTSRSGTPQWGHQFAGQYPSLQSHLAGTISILKYEEKGLFVFCFVLFCSRQGFTTWPRLARIVIKLLSQTLLCSATLTIKFHRNVKVKKRKPGVVAHSCNSRTGEEEAEEFGELLQVHE